MNPPPDPLEAFCPFPPEARNIFGPVFNGAEMVFYDPLRLKRRLQALLGSETQELLANWGHLDAQERFLAAVRAAFDLPPFDQVTGGGATEEVVLGLWDGYNGWLKKNGRGTPPSATTSPPTATPPDTPPPTPTLSVSPSTPTGSRRGVPGPLRGPAS